MEREGIVEVVVSTDFSEGLLLSSFLMLSLLLLVVVGRISDVSMMSSIELLLRP